MKVLIFTNYPFPFGLAQTNRLIAISKGLLHAGADVKVVITKATETHGKSVNTHRSGQYEGISFEYALPSTVRPRGALKRAYWFIKGVLNSWQILVREHKRGKIDAIFWGVTLNSVSLLFVLLCRIKRIKILHERSEYPFLSYSNSLIGRIKLNFYLRVTCRTFDGFAVISKSLHSYFSRYLRKDIPIFRLPILVETERFDLPGIAVQPRICYCGTMQGNKDGVPILIEAFARIADKYPQINLYLIGETQFNGFSMLKEKVLNLNLENRVIFAGRVEREQLPMMLSASSILVLARPYSKQAEGGFPTKLGEYLATGRVTIVTSVGDIPDFLTHGVNALLAEPGSVDDFAHNIQYAIENCETANSIGERGRQLAHDVFDYRVQGARLLEWIKTICECD